MNRLLMAGVISAIALTASAGAETATCTNGSFYAGAAAGFITHDFAVKVTEKAHDNNAKKILDSCKAMYDAVQAIKTTDVAEKEKAIETAKTAFIEAMYKQFVITNPDTNAALATFGAGTWMASVTNTSVPDNMGDFAKQIFENAVPGALALNNAASIINNAATTALKQTYNTKVKENITNLANTLFASGAPSTAYLTKALEDGQFLIIPDTAGAAGAVAAHKISELGAEIYKEGTKEVKDATGKVTTAAVAATGSFTTARATAVEVAALKAKNAVYEEYANSIKKVFADEKNKKAMEAIAGGDATIALVAAEVAKAEAISFGSGDKKEINSKPSGFAGEAFVGYDYRFDSLMVGANIYAGFDSSEGKIKDGKAGTEEADGMIIKRNMYFGLTPKFGFLVTPKLQIFLTAGIQGGKYEVDASNLTIEGDAQKQLVTYATKFTAGHSEALKAAQTKSTALDKTGTDLKAEVAKEATATDFKKGLVNTAADAVTAQLGEAAKVLTEIPSIQATAVDNPNAPYLKKYDDIKMKWSFVLGGGLQFEFTPDIFGTLSYRCQLKTKVLDSSETDDNTIFTVEDTNHTVTAGIGFRIGG
ncbi:MAG: hypothetical protein LBI26_00565 [Holosporales bacterium]|jgi:opacity protein-like surface antigen|nr:hypothetical protein [Holosporales bacterium]